MKTKFDTNEDLLIHIRESKYEGSLPYFYDQKDFPELSLIKDNWPLILEEVRNYEKRCGDITGMNTYTPPDLSSDNAWNNMYFDNYMWRFHTNRKHFPKTKIVFKEGNHDERWEKWLFLKAPEIFDDPEFKLASRLRLGELHIDVVQDKLPVKIGKLTVLHGHELQGGGGVNPARATFLKTLNSVVIGHVHKTSMHSEARMDGEIINVQSTGCLCGMYPMFARVNKWNQGFCYVEHDIKSGEYKLYNKLIIKGKVY